MKKSVLIVDGQTMLTDFLVPYLEREFPDFGFSKASSVPQAQLLMLHHVFDVVITDVFGLEPTGIFLIQEVKRRSPGTKCIVLSAEVQSFWVSRVLQDGAMGFVSKSAPCIEVVHALNAVLQGRGHLSPEVAQGYIQNLSAPSASDPLNALSARELEVFVQVGLGKSFKAVSELLNVSVKTISVHKYNIARKTGIDSSAKIARYCAERGLLNEPATKKSLPPRKQPAQNAAFISSGLPELVLG